MKTLMTALTALVTASLFATTGYWTGAVDGDWTNSANWKDGVIPGVLADSGSLGDTAIFDGAYLSDKKVTTIDFATLVSIKYIKVQGGATTPVFTFGKDAAQVIPMEYQGIITIGENAAGDSTPVPKLQGILSLSIGALASTWGGSEYENDNQNTRVTIYNYNPEQVLHINDFGAVTSAVTINSEALSLRGNNFQIDGFYLDNRILELYCYCKKLIVNSQFDKTEYLRDIFINHTDKCTIEVPAGITLYLPGKNNVSSGYYSLYVRKPLEIVGEGDVMFGCSFYDNNKLWPGPTIYSQNNGDVAIYTRMFCRNGATKAPWKTLLGELAFGGYAAPSAYATNVLTLAGENCISGRVVVTERAGAVRVSSIGRIGEQSALGFGGEVQLANGSAIEYTGAGETTDRTISITNHEVSAVGVLRHCGTGLLVYEGVVSQFVENVTFALDGLAGTDGRVDSVLVEGPIHDFAAPTLNLEKRGAGTWTLTAANTYTGKTTLNGGVLALSGDGSIAGSSGVEFNGGTLDLTAADGNVSLPAVSVAGGANVVVVGADQEVTLTGGASQTKGTLDLRTTDSLTSKVKVTGLAAGAAPAWLTVDGEAATVDENGCVHGPNSVWKAAESGDWETADNWSAGVPSATQGAAIDRSGADYTVTVNGGAVTKSLKVSNGATTLAIASGATLTQDGAATITIDGGAKVEVSGLYTVTNHEGRACLVDEGTTLAVNEGGRFEYTSNGDKGRFEIGPGATLVATNAKVVVGAGISIRGGIITTGGAAEYNGASELIMSREVKTGELVAFGTGSSTFNGTSVYIHSLYNQTGGFTICPGAEGETATVTFNDDSELVGYGTSIILGGRKNTTSILNVNSSKRFNENVYPGYQQFNKYDSGYMLAVGDCYGEGRLNVSRGGIGSGGKGMSIGGADGNDGAKDTAATGKVTLSGTGKLYVDAYAAYYFGWGQSTLLGTLIGNGFKSATTVAGRPFLGELEISDEAELETRTGATIVGLGAKGEGKVTQTGGSVKLVTVSPSNMWRAWLTAEDAASGKEENKKVYRNQTNEASLVVGCAHGKGAYTMTGGKLLPKTDVYVGGGETNIFATGRYYTDATTYRDCKSMLSAWTNKTADAEGKLSLSGSAEFTQTAYVPAHLMTTTVGADGTGEVEIIGSGVTFKPGNFVLKNRVSSTLSFVADANGVSPVVASGKATIASGSKLKVDLTNAKTRRFPLIRATEIEGEFAADDITITGAPADLEVVLAKRDIVGGQELRLTLKRGLLIRVR